METKRKMTPAEALARARAAKKGGPPGDAHRQAFREGTPEVLLAPGAPAQPGLPGRILPPAPTAANNRAAANLSKVSYSHQAMVDAILANPAITQKELASIFGYTETWVCRVIASDAFQAYLAERRDQIVDPVLRGNVEEAFRGMILQSITKLQKRLEAAPSDELLLGVMNGAARALGYGARTAAPVQIQQNFVALVPPKAESTDAWVKQVQVTRQVETLPNGK